MESTGLQPVAGVILGERDPTGGGMGGRGLVNHDLLLTVCVGKNVFTL